MIVKERIAYVLVNRATADVCYHIAEPLRSDEAEVIGRKGYEYTLRLNDAEGLELAALIGYESEKSAKAALRKLRKGRKTRSSVAFDPSKWELRKIVVSKRYEIS